MRSENVLITQIPDWSRITIISITYNSGLVIAQCMEQFRHVPNIIIIDNASYDDSLEIVRNLVPQAKIVYNKHGVGYGNAANQGFNLVETEFALTVNPDSIVTPEAVSALLKVADEFPEASIICPQNINLDGTPELTHDVPMFERQHIPPPYNKRAQEPIPEGNLCAEFVSGAVNLIRMSVINELGGFDENIYLYFEDDDLCLRMRAAGYCLILTSSAQIMHINAGSVRPSLHYELVKFWNYGWARLYIEQKYQGRSAMLALAVRHTTRFLLKAVGYSLLLQRKKATRDWGRLAGTLSYLMGRPSHNPRACELNEKWRNSHPG